ncbi:MAG: hypothetical protein KAJ19_07370, partial [Gammaproteobacteria bacterium]|nr:hypothetical protein [Gammaproteobacteria bacterium]
YPPHHVLLTQRISQISVIHHGTGLKIVDGPHRFNSVEQFFHSRIFVWKDVKNQVAMAKLT